MTFFTEIPLVVSYYTKNTLYEEEVQHLIASCKTWGIEHSVKGVEDRGSWEENCAMKPHFLQEEMKEKKRPLLFVDADAVFLRPIEFEPFMCADFAVIKYKEEEDIRFCVGAGTVYINATKGGREALALWCHYSECLYKEGGRALPFADQVSLYLTCRSNIAANMALLPLKYCKIFDQEGGGIDAKEVVIEQRQASRKCK